MNVTKWIWLAILWLPLSLTILCPFANAEQGQPAVSENRSAPATPQSASSRAPPSTSALLHPLSGFADEGRFSVFKDEEPLATISFKWQENGAFENQAAITLAGQSVKLSTTIVVDPEGRFSRITMQTPLGEIAIEREGDRAKKTFQGKIETTLLKPGTVLFENMSPALLSQAVRFYDRAKGGRQTFPAYLLPLTVEEASLEIKDEIERAVGGKDLRFTRYLFGVIGIDLTLWVDGSGKICLAEVPSQHAAFVREGFEELRQSPENDPLLSTPKFEVRIESNVATPMRDGVKLATDLYRPNSEGPFPVILVRTPYKKEMNELQARFFARRGYVFAVQDCRGRFSSPGGWEPFVNEPNDGYDTIEWLASQPWSSGKVGMIGGSYLGWVQWWAARERPPHLVTIIPNVSPPDPFYNVPYEYGVFFLVGSIWWAEILESHATADLSGVAFSKIMEKKYRRLLDSLPVIDLDQKVLGKKNQYWRKWLEHPSNDGYWAKASFLDRLKTVKIPVFHQSGWFDGDGIGTKLNYLRMVSHGHPNQKLVLGPWGHTPESHRRYGERDFGPEAIRDLPREYLRWFDYWLKGVDNGLLKEPLVSAFVMGSNHWLAGPTYPLPGTHVEKWYLGSGGHAATAKGDGLLSTKVAPPRSVADRYLYDPKDPTPDPNYYEEPEEPVNGAADSGRRIRSTEEKKREMESHHQNVTETRRDILVYSTEPFEKPLTFVGPVSAVLFASTSARDTDWFVSLMEVDRDGKIFPLVQGKLRARYRRGTSKPEFLASRKIYEYRIDLWHTGITIPPGHRLRVEVASASFPTFSRNLNTGGHNEKETRSVKAEQAIYHSTQYPSHILLPVIPESILSKP